jgi:hypothetical protein
MGASAGKAITVALDHGFVDIVQLLVKGGLDFRRVRLHLGSGIGTFRHEPNNPCKLVALCHTFVQSQSAPRTERPTHEFPLRQGLDCRIPTWLVCFLVTVTRTLLLALTRVTRPQLGLLHEACKRGLLGLVDACDTRRADVNHRLGHDTPLFLAARGGHTAIVELLLQREADIRLGSPTTQGEMLPLEVAWRNRHPHTVQLLVAHGADANAKVRVQGCVALPCLLHHVPQMHNWGAGVRGVAQGVTACHCLMSLLMIFTLSR